MDTHLGKKIMAQYREGGKARGLTSKKAKFILREGTAKGQPLTEKQKKFFGLIAGGGKPTRMGKMQEGGIAESEEQEMKQSGEAHEEVEAREEADEGKVIDVEWKKGKTEKQIQEIIDHTVWSQGTIDPKEIYDTLNERDEEGNIIERISMEEIEQSLERMEMEESPVVEKKHGGMMKMRDGRNPQTPLGKKAVKKDLRAKILSVHFI